ncbi:hypothetical protein AAKU55_004285 [Oxalobacteraceae bacterium GrIS 1.11]
MMPRADLLELTPEALSALSNAGFVKRAQKDAAEGKLPPVVQLADGTVVARYGDGAVTALAPGRALRDATCSCPASGLCRHRVGLVLAYQAQQGVHEIPPAPAPWCPSQLAEAVQQLPRATLEQARRLAAARPLVRLGAGDTPAARLPMCDVRFFSRSSLALARCDCQQGANCAHIALAVWAFVQGQRQQPGFETLSIEFEPDADGSAPAAVDPDAAAAYAAIGALATRLWLDGTGQNWLALASAFEHAQQLAAGLGWRWVAEGLDQLQQGVAGQHARASGADPARLLHLLSSLMTRLAAARAAEASAASGTPPALPARQILGIGIKGEVALEHLRLVPLGAQCWRDDRGDGVRLIWADPDTLAVTVLEKHWPQAAPGVPPSALRERRLIGMPLHRLAVSQVVTKAARRRANGMLAIGAAATQTSVLPLSARAWDTLGMPLRQPDLASLRAYLRGLAPDFVRPLQAIEHVHVLPVAAVLDSAWDAASQTLNAQLLIGAARVGDADPDPDPDPADILLVQFRHDPVAPGAVDALARALAGFNGTPLAIAGSIGSAAGRLRMAPLALLTTEGLVVPQLSGGAVPLAVKGAAALASSALNALLDASVAMLANCLRQGLRHQGHAAFERAAAQATLLRAAGLGRSARALDAMFEALKGGAMDLLAERLAALHALLETLAADSAQSY